MMHFGWPQWVMAAITAAVFIGALYPPTGTHDKWVIPIWVGITWVLWMGGFY